MVVGEGGKDKSLSIIMRVRRWIHDMTNTEEAGMDDFDDEPEDEEEDDEEEIDAQEKVTSDR